MMVDDVTPMTSLCKTDIFSAIFQMDRLIGPSCHTPLLLLQTSRQTRPRFAFSFSAQSFGSPNFVQPQPDPALLNTSQPEASGVADDTAKVNVVAQSFRESPRTYTSEANRFPDEQDDTSESDSEGRRKDRRLREVKAEGAYLWAALKRYLLRPETAGGCLGLCEHFLTPTAFLLLIISPVNLGLLGSLGRTLYIKPALRKDTAFIFSAVAATLGLFAVEGYAAEKYRQTPRGWVEERRAKEEGAYLFAKAREIVLRPKVFGGFVGLSECYLAYDMLVT
jgi:hypothetical protein